MTTLMNAGTVAVNASVKAKECKRDAPPRAPLAFRVGVVGHRPNRLQQADLEKLAAVLRTILKTVQEEVRRMHRDNPSLFDVSAPVVRAISPLAEGTDRIFAEQALALRCEFCCVLPFAQAEFERDFVPAPGPGLEENSVARFRDLLDQASTVFELDGCRDDEAGAYGAGGRTVLNQSDLLAVVWDGERQGKRGGTEETFDAARRQGVPVVWVDAHAPHRWQILNATTLLTQPPAGQRLSPDGASDTESLRECVHAALDMPKPQENQLAAPHANSKQKNDDPQRGLHKFYREHQPRWTSAVAWKAFRDIFGDGKRPRVKFSIDPFEESSKDEWPEDQSSAVSRLVDWLRPYYAWPDKLAVIFADRYRSSFIMAYLLSALAVGMALFSVGFSPEFHLQPDDWYDTLSIVCELFAILFVLALVSRGNLGRWHQRWIDYRVTAELVRHLRLIAPLGGGRPFPQIPAHWAIYGQPSSTWMAWYVRAVERALGLPTAIVTRDYLVSFLDHLGQLVKGQVGFHEVTARRCQLIEQRLHWFAIRFLALTLVACVLHLLLPRALGHDALPEALPALLTFFCGFLPALGAAIGGIINQGEFRRVEKRSESMREQLLVVRSQIERLRQQVLESADPPREQFSVRAAALTADASRLLLNDVLDWRVIFLDRPFDRPPG